TSIAFLRAYGAEGIPHAFIVDKSGSVVWHGHPMDRLEDALDRVLAGTMDPKLEAEMRELLPLWAMEYMVLAKYGRDTAEADRVGEYLVAHGALMPDLLNRFVPYFFSQEGLAYRNTAFVARVAKVAYDAAPGDAHTAELYARALFENGQAAEAAALVKEVLPAAIGDSQLRSRLDAALEKYEAAAAG
ncbi:MAG: hypothetical protein JXR94_02385, partial [Candidatus Hydrogenedentes bacterium]|nr:hypothetical protein [Candidatus Hydrogenedentota bacterium]